MMLPVRACTRACVLITSSRDLNKVIVGQVIMEHGRDVPAWKNRHECTSGKKNQATQKKISEAPDLPSTGSRFHSFACEPPAAGLSKHLPPVANFLVVTYQTVCRGEPALETLSRVGRHQPLARLWRICHKFFPRFNICQELPRTWRMEIACRNGTVVGKGKET
jgi:hypothetical protein